MAGRTNTETIRELEKTVATLNERINGVRRDIDRLEAAGITSDTDSQRTSTFIAEMRTQVTVIQKRFEDLKQTVESREQKRWGLTLVIVSALLASIATALLQKYLP